MTPGSMFLTVAVVIGSSGDTLSIVAHGELFETADYPLFEIFDHKHYATYWVRDIPTPPQAAQIIRQHGKPPKEEWDEP